MPGAPDYIHLGPEELCYFAYQECLIGDHSGCKFRPEELDRINPINWRSRVENNAGGCEHHGKILSMIGWEEKYKLVWSKKEKPAPEEVISE